MGSVAAARRAGTKHASVAATTRRRVTAARTTGSRELSVTHFVATLSKATLNRMPAASPLPTFTAVDDSTMRKTSEALAPRAIRIPNSFVRVATPYETTLYKPTEARASAKIEKIPNSVATSRRIRQQHAYTAAGLLVPVSGFGGRWHRRWANTAAPCSD